ncbi:conserved hypothetical protein [Uncinocarpus reesii 1704]|uniref:Uncharacterized protein n=1 Tax=Uncinocarpus reesii (strain UAMH 1704) TaxID=336963 RepID=C4JQT9_UNCRE|nr:uncharacterized protein UREG_03421 [Uncinocarpus reesii 1704]EEP78575.1 conserved hypothetical protein [Uncinocarpus reesii 1704]
MAITMRLAAKFNSYYAERPVLTTMVTNASITAVRSRAKSSRRTRGSDDSFMSLEIHDLHQGKKPTTDLATPKRAPHPFDFERLTRFMAYGFFMAPIQFQWFGFLSRIFPITKKHATIPALKRVAMDQLIFAPIGCLYTDSESQFHLMAASANPEFPHNAYSIPNR